MKMKKTLCLFICGISAALSSYGLDIALNSGDVYKYVEIIQNTPLGVSFVKDDAAGWANFTDMQPDAAGALGYDPDKAAAFDQRLKDNHGCLLSKDAVPEEIPQSVYQNPDNDPPSAGNTIYVNPGDTVPYVAGLVALPVTTWVYWNGKLYPYYWWHQWYWQNHWTFWNGHFYPSHYLYKSAVWHNGQYYPYRHNLLEGGPEGARQEGHGEHRSSEHSRPGGHYGGHGGGRRR